MIQLPTIWRQHINLIVRMQSGVANFDKATVKVIFDRKDINNLVFKGAFERLIHDCDLHS